MATLRQINTIIHRTVSPRMELVRGEGYHYFIYDDLDDSGVYEETSIMEPYTSGMAVDDWVGLARQLVNELEITDPMGDIQWLN